MARIHLAWELGAAFGHAGRLKLLSVELARRGHEIALSLLDLVGTRAAMRELPFPCFQSPVWLANRAGAPAPLSLAEILQSCGYRDPGELGALVGGWRSTLAATRADLVVADFAPTATLAARTLGIPTASVGLGYSIPPAGMPLPSLRPWERSDPGRLAAAEAAVVATANRVMHTHGAPPFTRAWQILHGERALLCNWPELDCYARGPLPPGERWFGPTFDPGMGEPPAWPPGVGPRVFAYLKAGHPGVAPLLGALAARGCRTLCYYSDGGAGRSLPFEHPSIAYSGGPVKLSEALAECDLCACHAGGATVAQSLLAGVPMLLLPQQNEQGLNAIGVARTGAAIAVLPQRTPFDFRAALARLLDDGAPRAAARAFAEAHRDFSQERQVRELCDAIEAAAHMRPGADADGGRTPDAG